MIVQKMLYQAGLSGVPHPMRRAIPQFRPGSVRASGTIPQFRPGGPRAIPQFIPPSIRGAATALGVTAGNRAIDQAMVTKLGSSQGVAFDYRAVHPDAKALVVNAISNNWGLPTYDQSGMTATFPYQPGATSGGDWLAIHQGEWIVVVGDPFAEGCVVGSGCKLVILATESQQAAMAGLYSAMSGGADAFLLEEGPAESGISHTLDELETEIKRAALGLRWGALIGAGVGIGVILLAARR